MIVKRYGDTICSVTPHFDARAISEIGVRRNGVLTMPAAEFFQRYERVEARELTAEREGMVQHEVKDAVLRDLEAQVLELSEGLGADHALLIESEPGVDYPKLRERKKNVVVAGENRFLFQRWVDPPLRVGVYRKAGWRG